MLYFHIKILLRYRQILFVPGTIILSLLFFKYLLLPKNITVCTVVPFSMFVFCFVEDIYNNLFDIPSNEFRSYQLFPTKFQKMVEVKNYAAFFVVIVYSMLISLIAVLTLHISSYTMLLSFTYSLTIVFPLIAFGNLIFSYATRLNSLNYGLIRMILNVFMVINLSLPYFIIKIIFMNILFCYPYILATIFFWRYISIPITSKQLLKNSYTLLEST